METLKKKDIWNDGGNPSFTLTAAVEKNINRENNTPNVYTLHLYFIAEVDLSHRIFQSKHRNEGSNKKNAQIDGWFVFILRKNHWISHRIKWQLRKCSIRSHFTSFYEGNKMKLEKHANDNFYWKQSKVIQTWFKFIRKHVGIVLKQIKFPGIVCLM